MKQRGRKSAALRLIGAQPHLVAITPPDDAPPPPSHLGEPEKEIWRAVVTDFKGTCASSALLAAGLEAHQRAREARQIIEDEGLTVTGRDGQAKAHPLCNVERDARKAFAAVFRQLGIKL